MSNKTWKGICPNCNKSVMIEELELHMERYMPEEELRAELKMAKSRIHKMKKQNLAEHIAELGLNYTPKMKKLQSNPDREGAHVEADKLLCDVLEHLGFQSLVAEFVKLPKWYA